MAYDSTGTQGALLDMPSTDLRRPITIRLERLQAVHVEIQMSTAISGKDAELGLWTPTGSQVGRVLILGSNSVIMLPRGKYQLYAASPDVNPVQQTFSVVDRAVKLPTMELSLTGLARHYGHGAPELVTVLDMDHQPFNFGSWDGRWTLIYFYADWCLPCVKEGIPKLIAFTKEHSASSDKFRIIAVHVNGKDNQSDWETFHRQTVKLEKEVWHTIPPFVLCFDESTQMTSIWGIRSVATTALIGPDGNLVQGGDLTNLAKELSKSY
jgi:thiol-disulfide isomerase/thioredoxin